MLKFLPIAFLAMTATANAQPPIIGARDYLAECLHLEQQGQHRPAVVACEQARDAKDADTTVRADAQWNLRLIRREVRL